MFALQPSRLAWTEPSRARLVSISPVRMGDTGTSATTRVRINASSPALPAEAVTG